MLDFVGPLGIHINEYIGSSHSFLLGNGKLFYKVVVPVYTSTRNKEEFPLLCIFANVQYY